jgi:hypothetical protein
MDIITFLELKVLLHFMERLQEDSKRELHGIFVREKMGEFPGLDDFGNAVYLSEKSFAVGIRAVHNELWVIVESVVRTACRPAWHESNKHKGPKDIFELVSQGKEFSKLRTIEDLPFNMVIKLFPLQFGFEIAEVAGWENLKSLKLIVDSMKHRKGRKAPRDLHPTEDGITAKWDVSYSTALEGINEVRDFVRRIRKLPARGGK